MLKLRYDLFGSEVLGDAQFDGKYEFPVSPGVRLKYLPSNIIPFDRLGTIVDGEWVHFYVHDRRFVNFLSKRNRYGAVVNRAGGFIGIDNSIYRDLPLAEQIHSCYLNRAVDYYLTKKGKTVVPNVSWGDWRSYEFCCDGISSGTTIAVSTYGCCRSAIDKSHFEDGLSFVVGRLQPYSIVVYGAVWRRLSEYIRYHDLNVMVIPSWRSGKVKEAV